MPSDPDRVYIGDEKEAPEDAIVRQSDNGRLYYCPKERGRNNHNGGNKDNGLLETSRQDLVERANDEEAESRRVYVGKEAEVPEGVEPQEDDEGRVFYRQQDVWEEARLFYPDDTRDEVEDETDVDLEEGEQTEGVQSEEAAEQQREDLASQAEEEFSE